MERTRGRLEQQDFEIIAILRNPSVCIGTENLHVQVLVANQGEASVDLDVSRLSTTAGFVALVDITEMKFRHDSFSSVYDPIGPAPPARVTTLLPKGLFKRDMEIPINSPFFRSRGLLQTEFVELGTSE